MLRYTQIFYGTGPMQFMNVYWGKEKADTTIVLLHGGFFKPNPEYGVNLMQPIAEALNADGYSVVNVEYPRVGEEGVTALHIIASVYDALDQIPLIVSETTKIVVMGHSAGGYLALLCAARKAFQKNLPAGTSMSKPVVPNLVIAQAPLVDLWDAQQRGLSDNHDAVRNFVDAGCAARTGKNNYDLLSPVSYAPECIVDIIHGENDVDVPIQHAELYFDRYHNSFWRAHLHREDCDHYDLIDPTKPVWYVHTALISLV